MKRQVTFNARVLSVDDEGVTIGGILNGEVIKRTFQATDGFVGEDYKSEFKIGDLVKYELILVMERISEV